jgi:hypothetical protein
MSLYNCLNNNITIVITNGRDCGLIINSINKLGLDGKIIKIGAPVRFHKNDNTKSKRYSIGDYGVIDSFNNFYMYIKIGDVLVKKTIKCFNNIEQKDIMPAYAISHQCLRKNNIFDKYGVIYIEEPYNPDLYTKLFDGKDIIIIEDWCKKVYENIGNIEPINIISETISMSDELAESEIKLYSKDPEFDSSVDYCIKNRITIVMNLNFGSNQNLTWINERGLELSPEELISIELPLGIKKFKLGMPVRFHQNDRSKSKSYKTGDYGIITGYNNKNIYILTHDYETVEKPINCFNNVEKKVVMPAYAISCVCLKYGNHFNKYGIIGDMYVTTANNDIYMTSEKLYSDFFKNKNIINITGFVSVYNAETAIKS